MFLCLNLTGVPMTAVDWRTTLKDLRVGDEIFIRGDCKERLGLDIAKSARPFTIKCISPGLSQYCICIQIADQPHDIRWIRIDEVLCKKILISGAKSKYPTTAEMLLKPREITYKPYVPPPPNRDILLKIGAEGK